ncbi:MAG TPA: hypothetical protein VEV13_07510 [Candidatus Limnocylindria bacterium]|nr:hypothetical protein [Candidatus Limnocylindria bacterium]
MSRRASLPGAAELFRATGPGGLDEAYEANGPASASGEAPVRAVPDLPTGTAAPGTPGERPRAGVRQTAPRRSHVEDRRPSGRERHDEKITVYVSGDELFDLEQARLVLRGSHGLAVDRGRIVREALALVIADLDAKGESSILVRRLRQG